MLRGVLPVERHAARLRLCPRREEVKQRVEHLRKVALAVVVEAIVEGGDGDGGQPIEDRRDLIALEDAHGGAHEPRAVWQPSGAHLHADRACERINVVARRRRRMAGADGAKSRLRHYT